MELYKQRDFGQIFNDVFGYIRYDFKPIMKTYLFFLGGMFLVKFMFMTFLFSSFFNHVQDFMDSEDPLFFLLNNPSLYGLIVLTGVIMIFTRGVIVVLMSIRADDKEKEITVKELVKGSLKVFPKLLFAHFLIAVGSFIVLLIFGIIVGLFISVVQAFAIIFFFYIVLLIGILYFSVKLDFLFFIMVKEKKNFFEAVGLSFSLTKQNFWLALGVLVVTSIMVSIMSYISYVPAYLVLIIKSVVSPGYVPFNNDILLYIALGAGNYIAGFVRVLLIVTSGILYFSYVEKAEGVGMLRKLEALDEEDSSKL